MNGREMLERLHGTHHDPFTAPEPRLAPVEPREEVLNLRHPEPELSLDEIRAFLEELAEDEDEVYTDDLDLMGEFNRMN